MALSGQLKRLGKHSAIYGLGGLVSRILAVLLLPLYTHYLSTSDYGQIETLIALVTVLTIVLQFGIGSAFFRFYFDADDHDGRRLVLRTSFWFTMTMATLGLVLVVALAVPISEWLFDDAGAANLVRAQRVRRNPESRDHFRTTALIQLYRRTLHASKGTEHTAISCQRPEQLSAPLALVKEDARVDRHLLLSACTAFRTGDDGA